MSITIKDVSRVSGISIATVSKYLNNVPVRVSTAKKIARAIEELGYVPNPSARGLRTSETKVIGILVDNITNNFYNMIVARLSKSLKEKDYACYIQDFSSENEESIVSSIRFLSQKRVDGVYVITNSVAPDVAALLKEYFQNIVMIDCVGGSLNADFVVTDNLSAAYAATEQFIIGHHSKIALITGYDSFFSAHERSIGYQRALQDYEIEVNEDFIFRESYDMQGGYKAFEKLASYPPEERPTAVLIASYFMTIGTIIALNEHKLSIPQDISVICFDNYDINKVFVPALTCVTQPTDAICRKAVDCMMERVSGQVAEARIFRLNASLEKGDSVQSID